MRLRVFIPQETLDGWISTNSAELRGDALVFRDAGGTLHLQGAARFVRVADAGPDPHGVVGKVKSEAALGALGAEIYMTSAILGEIAYDVEPGFIADRQGDAVDASGWRRTLRALGS